MIRLVVTDIDGTLIPEGTDRLNPEYYPVIRRLKQMGIAFAAASGRQYGSMQYLFAPVEQDVFFISENGSNVMADGKNLSADFMDPELAEEVVRYLRTLPDSVTVLSVPERMYMESDDEAVRALLENGYHNEIQIVDDLIPLCSHTNKLCVYCRNGSAGVAQDLTGRFGEKLNTMVSGEKWVDFMSRTADKGHALSQLQEALGISPAETMAFGDNCNDIGMLNCAEESYAVSNAHPDVILAAKHTAGTYQEDGVLQILKKLLEKQSL